MPIVHNYPPSEGPTDINNEIVRSILIELPVFPMYSNVNFFSVEQLNYYSFIKRLVAAFLHIYRATLRAQRVRQCT